MTGCPLRPSGIGFDCDAHAPSVTQKPAATPSIVTTLIFIATSAYGLYPGSRACIALGYSIGNALARSSTASSCSLNLNPITPRF